MHKATVETKPTCCTLYQVLVLVENPYIVDAETRDSETGIEGGHEQVLPPIYTSHPRPSTICTLPPILASMR
jgi:hypothetical protein